MLAAHDSDGFLNPLKNIQILNKKMLTANDDFFTSYENELDLKR
jgi:hypothetical protein